MKVKKLAVLLLVHKNTEQVKRLVNKMDDDNIDVYIHCDKRWNTGFEELKKFFQSKNNIYIIEDRVYTDLDSFNLAEAPLKMIGYSKKIGMKYNYYALLSGQDYPLVSSKELLDNLDCLYPKPLIDCVPYEKNNFVHTKFASYGLYRKCERTIYTKIRNRKIAHMVVFPVVVFWKTIGDSIYNLKRSFDRMNVGLYGGSAWWILPDIAIDYIYDEYRNNPKLMKLLSKAFTPEENFYQIMTMQSPAKNLVDINNFETEQKCKTYAHFRPEGKEITGHPYIFTIDDKDLISKIKNDYFFARKFDVQKDFKILDYIDSIM